MYTAGIAAAATIGVVVTVTLFIKKRQGVETPEELDLQSI
jgi:hypothetical protein